MKVNNNLARKMLIFLLSIVIILIIGVIIIPKAFAQPQPISEIEIFSENADYNKKEPGAWKVTKSAKWTAKGEALITFDINSIFKENARDRDVLFVIDVSGSMLGDRIDRVKRDATELVEKLLTNKNNKVGIITFAYEGNIVSDLTDNEEDLINKIDSMNANGGTSYYKGLVCVDRVLENYKKEKNKDLVVLFLTDGYPSVDVPNEEAQFTYLKDKYPFMNVKGIQYEMDSDILDAVVNVSDEQYIADMESLNNVLFSASDLTIKYDNFEIDDYINTDYFYVDDVSDIKANQGKIKFDKENQKINWKMDNYSSSGKAKLSIKLMLKSEFSSQDSFFPTNKNEKVKSKIGDITEDVESHETPVLATKYKVVYDMNAPDCCEVTGDIPDEKRYSVFDIVELNDTTLKCNKYQFKGWKIVQDVDMINDDYFMMPEEDIVIRAIWSKVQVSKSTNGSVLSSYTLYDQVESDAKNNRNARVYTGDTNTFNGKEKIYYYYGDANNNNVKFANFCWKIVRTTDTGGVKLLYNGEPDNAGTCSDERPDHFGFVDNKFVFPFPDAYYYADNYIKDDNSKKFTLKDNITKGSSDSETTFNPVGKYACLGDSTSCSTLYYITDYTNSSSSYIKDSGHATELNYSTNYANLGDWRFNSNDTGLAGVGYMYNATYSSNMKMTIPDSPWTSAVTMLSEVSLSTDYYYASNFTYSKPDLSHMFEEYHLVNPYKISSSSQYSSLVGKYFISPYFDKYIGSTVGPGVYYIVEVHESKAYVLSLSDGKSLSTVDQSFVFYDSVSQNSSGQYVVNAATSSKVKKSQWHKLYSNYKGKFYIDSSGKVCQIDSCSPTNFSYTVDLNSINYKYGSSFVYDKTTGQYTLSGKVQNYVNLDGDYSKLKDTHYTCFNTTGKCSTISYYYDFLGSYILYINLTNGDSIEAAIKKMLNDSNVNTKDSKIKTLLDIWYSNHLTEYTSFLEDAVWCNDRTISKKGGWDSSGTDEIDDLALRFNGAVATDSLGCSNVNDRFTVGTNNGNGKLKYPIGLITAQEYILAYANKKSFLNGHDYYWTLTPYGNDERYTRNTIASYDNFYGYSDIGGAAGVRPSISLAHKITFSHGSGTVDNPYVIGGSNDS